MPTVNVREAAMEKSGLNGKTDGDAIRRELYERTISKLRADPNEESEQAPMDSVLIEKIVDYCKKSLGLSELLAGLNYPGVAYGLMIWEQALSNTPSAVEYLLKIAELVGVVIFSFCTTYLTMYTSFPITKYTGNPASFS
jgi:hypothetical protein